MAVPDSYRAYSTRALQVRKVIPVLAAAFAAIVVFAALDVLLTRITEARRSASARWSYSQGERLSASGRLSDASDLFRAAYNQDPANSAYQLALIAALRRAGELDQAKLTVGRLLEKSPADGAANIEMARILAHSGDWRNAAWYYHRGLYGQWRTPIELVPLRFELADFLASNHATEDLLAELPLLDREVTDPMNRRHVGKLLIAAQSWRRAEDLYRSLLRTSESDGELWAGLGKAQLGAGEYEAAERSLIKANAYLRDADIQRGLQLAANVNDLDPTRRGLSATERHRRAHEIASAVVAAVENCAPGDATVQSAKAALVHRRNQKAADSAESDLDLTEETWTAGEKVCGGTIPVREPVRRVILLMLKRVS
jgi:tetratricopeptide (TPR) repeat protein